MIKKFLRKKNVWRRKARLYRGLRVNTTKPKGHLHFTTYTTKVVSNGSAVVAMYFDLGTLLTTSAQYASLTGVYKRVKVVSARVRFYNSNPVSTALATPIAIGYNPQAVLSAPSSTANVTDNDSHIVVSPFDTVERDLVYYPKVLANVAVDSDGFFQMSLSTGANLGMIQIYQDTATVTGNAIGFITLEFNIRCTYDS